MDSRCKFCGEPFDLDEFHGLDEPWSKWVKAFNKFGCGAAEAAMDGLSCAEATRCTHKPILPEEHLQGVALIQSLLGDDHDGACTIIDDLIR